mgnify:CR=1 FL=1
MKTLARWYDINIFYTSSKLEQIQFTGELIRYKNIEELLSKFEILEKDGLIWQRFWLLTMLLL